MKKLDERGRFMPYVEIEWRDSHTAANTAWHGVIEAEDYHKQPCNCSTMGYLVKSDARGVTLAMSVNDSGQVGGLWHIPIGIIRKVRRLRRRA